MLTLTPQIEHIPNCRQCLFTLALFSVLTVLSTNLQLSTQFSSFLLTRIVHTCLLLTNLLNSATHLTHSKLDHSKHNHLTHSPNLLRDTLLYPLKIFSEPVNCTPAYTWEFLFNDCKYSLLLAVIGTFENVPITRTFINCMCMHVHVSIKGHVHV